MRTRQALRRLNSALIVVTVTALAGSLLTIGWARVDAERMRTGAVPAHEGLAGARQFLAEANTAALTGFANRAAATAGPSEDYQTAIGAASRQLAQVAEADLGETIGQGVQVVESLLVTYMGLMEQARAYLYADPESPLGQAYLWYAYRLLSDEIQPQFDSLSTEVDAVVPGAAIWWRNTLWIVPLLLLLALLVGTQVFLARRFRRTLSAPLVAATAVVLVLAWTAYLSIGIDEKISTGRGTLSALVGDYESNKTSINETGCALQAGLPDDWHVKPDKPCSKPPRLVPDLKLLADASHASTTTQEASAAAERAMLGVSVLALIAILLITRGMLSRIEEYRYRPR